MNKLLLVGAIAVADVIPAAIDLDGTNDFFSRSADLSGNADSKTFTISAWAYTNEITGSGLILELGATNTGLALFIATDGSLRMTGRNAATTVIVEFDETPPAPIPNQTFSHILISFDLTNVSNRFVYINDLPIAVDWNIYTDDTVNNAQTSHRIGGRGPSSLTLKGRLSEIFVDYTFRDLSLSANRRLFTTIDEERGLIPAAGQDNLTPIIYLPMDDPATAFVNEGTGGDFVQNGVINQSNRGPGQYNSAASEFDGAGDWLQNRSSFGLTAGRLAIFSFTLRDNTQTNERIFSLVRGSTNDPKFDFRTGASGGIVLIRNAAGTVIFNSTAVSLGGTGRNLSVQIAIDMDDLSKCLIVINGVVTTLVSATFTSNDIPYDDVDRISIGALDINTPSNLWNGAIGDLYFNPTYIDLSTVNPFYDSVTSKPKYLGESGELPTGSSPLVYAPIRGGSAGDNLGTAGDFTVNSGPFVGARGGSEYWSRSVVFPTFGTDFLTAAALASEGKLVTYVVSLLFDSASTNMQMEFRNNADDALSLRFTATSAGAFLIIGRNQAGTTILNATSSSGVLINNEWQNILVSLDLSNASNRIVNINGIDISMTWTTFTDDNLDIDNTVNIAGDSSPLNDLTLSNIYFKDQFIDFSDESTRLLFIDGLGFPLPLQASIDEGLVPEGLIRMGFEDTSNLGLNSGSGGNFTINGTVITGEDVNG